MVLDKTIDSDLASFTCTYKDETSPGQHPRPWLRQYIIGHSRTSFGMFRIAWRTPKSPKTSSVPPRTLGIIFLARDDVRDFWSLTRRMVQFDETVWFISHLITLDMLQGTYVFNMLAHPSFGNTSATKYLDGVICGLLSRLCSMHFEKTNGALPHETQSNFSGRCSDIPSKLICLFLVALWRRLILLPCIADENHIPSDSSDT